MKSCIAVLERVLISKVFNIQPIIMRKAFSCLILDYTETNQWKIATEEALRQQNTRNTIINALL